MDNNVVGRIEYAQVRMSMIPTHNIKLWISIRSIKVELRPGIGVKRKMNGPVIVATDRERRGNKHPGG
jgi:hypothetical protein